MMPDLFPFGGGSKWPAKAKPDDFGASLQATLDSLRDAEDRKLQARIEDTIATCLRTFEENLTRRLAEDSALVDRIAKRVVEMQEEKAAAKAAESFAAMRYWFERSQTATLREPALGETRGHPASTDWVKL